MGELRDEKQSDVSSSGATRSFLRALVFVFRFVWKFPNNVIAFLVGMAGVPLGARGPVYDRGFIWFHDNPLLNNLARGWNPGADVISMNCAGVDYASVIEEHEIQHGIQGDVLGPFFLPAYVLCGCYGLIRGKGFFTRDGNIFEYGPYQNPPRPWPWGEV